ncbi:hypothetical protein PPYR_00347 [Photinus pyralis]|uniref:3-hydroxy-3-methylglutaryl coenzyme A reductase n=1 Tax=Photinus pyralis TaxID=7054 RepID=A0A5N4B1A1_PHOPY|nr:3-hydroxy-3-methylglutaryl-coenzyme A reductase-like isoform X1 [Photinus pyralis]XP_031335246.1 3-hydroxy-3-methylglutaryl-coenzyme A reductase-like isoform X1 [Photinus pyralis]KAB0803377.1 hypothetical protein PPYR_00347 [Photinus pyralis]
MATKLFYTHGEFCASHPWELIVGVLTLMTSMLTLEQHYPRHDEIGFLETERNGADAIVMTLIRCATLLHGYFQLRQLCKVEHHISAIVSLFTIFSFIFTWMITIHFPIEAVDLQDALLIFLFLMDTTRARKLAQFVFNNGSREEVASSIATGVSLLGPSMLLDTIIELLIIGVGGLSGLTKLEPLLYSASLAIAVNYVILMTLFPACLSLILGLSYLTKTVRITVGLELEKFNPVVQRVKLIMCGGLLLVHFNNWNSLKEYLVVKMNCGGLLNTVHGWLLWRTDYLLILIFLLVLLAQFVLFERDQLLTFIMCDRNISESKEVQQSTLKECLRIYISENSATNLTDKEVINLVENKHVQLYQIEKAVGDAERGVKIRRQILGEQKNLSTALQKIPYENYNYQDVLGTCCENVIGYIPVPVGIVGPLRLDGCLIHVPMATTEGCLVASTNRGTRAILETGVTSRVVSDGMTRGPVVRFPSIVEANDCKMWLEKTENFATIKASFDSSSRFARLTKVYGRMAGRYLFIRFVATTGDAMGMNMLSKGTELSLNCLRTYFPSMEIVSLSGNFCTDKKPSAVNWIEGRGKSVVCEAIVPAHTVTTVLKTSASAMVDVNISKNLIGSSIAGSIGGFNSHASNIVTAIFIATGQDPAQNVTSSNCITLMEPWGDDSHDLYISCTMPSIEIGTVGGGTILAAQAACLDLLGVKGSHPENPGKNADKLARIVCASVLAGELSVMAALTAGHIVTSHLKYNRSSTTLNN